MSGFKASLQLENIIVNRKHMKYAARTIEKESQTHKATVPFTINNCEPPVLESLNSVPL